MYSLMRDSRVSPRMKPSNWTENELVFTKTTAPETRSFQLVVNARLAVGARRASAPGLDVSRQQLKQTVSSCPIQGVGKCPSGTLFWREIDSDNPCLFQLIEALH